MDRCIEPERTDWEVANKVSRERTGDKRDTVPPGIVDLVEHDLQGELTNTDLYVSVKTLLGPSQMRQRVGCVSDIVIGQNGRTNRVGKLPGCRSKRLGFV